MSTRIQLFSVESRLSSIYEVNSTPPVDKGFFHVRVIDVLVISETDNGLHGIDGGPYLPLGVIDSSGSKGVLNPTLFLHVMRKWYGVSFFKSETSIENVFPSTDPTLRLKAEYYDLVFL